MTVWAVNGAAGFGKTYRLLQRIGEELEACPLESGQKVLALTFMHGARQRLEQKLRGMPALRGKYECLTVDGFARSLRWRWRSLAKSIGQQDIDTASFDDQCALAATLASRAVVGHWLATGYPCVLLDEGQDLDPHRLQLIEALSVWCRVFIAYDDFQCLRVDLRPSPVSTWLPAVCKPEELAKPQRCSVPALLDASSALRAGQAPAPGSGLKIVECKGATHAAALLASTIHFARYKTPGCSVAVITPSRKGGYAAEVLEMVGAKPCGTRKLGPFKLKWESSDSPLLETIAEMGFDGEKPCGEMIHAVLAAAEEGAARDALVRWILRQRDVAVNRPGFRGGSTL